MLQLALQLINQDLQTICQAMLRVNVSIFSKKIVHLFMMTNKLINACDDGLQCAGAFGNDVASLTLCKEVKMPQQNGEIASSDIEMTVFDGIGLGEVSM
jgi:hypothetical protein